MKHPLITFLLILCVGFSFAQNKEVLNNKSIVDLTVAGMSKKIILSKIEAATCKFTTDTKSLISLKKSGVDEDVIDAMVTKMTSSESNGKETSGTKTPPVDKAKNNDTPAATTTSTSATEKLTSQSSPMPDPKVIAFLKKEGSGIYYYDPVNNSIQELESTVFSQQKNNNWSKAFTHGFGKSTKVMSVSGEEANVQFKKSLPHFYFYFDPENKSLNAQAPTWFASVTSPNEFLLIKFETKVKNSRAVTTASGNAYENAQGIDDRYKRDKKFRKLEKGIYEVYFEEGLEYGEYGFMYAGATAVNGGSSPKVYDFGVKQ
ncbi:MAG: hypothetical protein QM764_22880 [Chitinophagaceae bacterium]